MEIIFSTVKINQLLQTEPDIQHEIYQHFLKIISNAIIMVGFAQEQYRVCEADKLQQRICVICNYALNELKHFL